MMLSTKLVDGIAFTLAFEEEGWRFVAWSSADEQRWLPDPPDARERRFASDADAIEYFRRQLPCVVRAAAA